VPCFTLSLLGLTYPLGLPLGCLHLALSLGLHLAHLLAVRVRAGLGLGGLGLKDIEPQPPVDVEVNGAGVVSGNPHRLDAVPLDRHIR
jgi:hypothetical protein